VYARLDEELRRVRTRGLEVEVIPGVTAACAATAALEWELTSEADRRPLVLASATAPDGALAPRLERVTSSCQALALYMTRGTSAELQQSLVDQGYPPGTACGIARRVSWPGQVLDRCSLADLGERLEGLEVDGSTVILVAAAGDLDD
jgi:precorrin-4 methylase